MKITVIFPIQKNNIKIEDCLAKLQPFLKKHSETDTIFVVNENYDISATKKIKTAKTLVIKKVTVNDAVEVALPYIKGEVLLIADTKIDCCQIFEKMLEKHKQGYDIINSRRNTNGFCEFFNKFGRFVSNIFFKMYVDKQDFFANPTVQLLGKNVVDIMKEIPYRSGLLRNCNRLAGMKYSAIRIDEKTDRNKYNIKTPSFICFLVALGVLGATILSIILCNTLMAPNITANIILGFVGVICLVMIALSITRHMLNVRMMTSDQKVLKKINFGSKNGQEKWEVGRITC